MIIMTMVSEIDMVKTKLAGRVESLFKVARNCYGCFIMKQNILFYSSFIVEQSEEEHIDFTCSSLFSHSTLPFSMDTK